MQGFLSIYKPTKMSSAFVVRRVKRKLNTPKVGHMGTLDPLAVGILPIAIGKATRMFDYFLDKNKKYIAHFTFGYITNTLDSDGEVEDKTDVVPTKEEVLKILPNFAGKINQMPPNFSAKKVGGMKAYELARMGVEVELKPKEIEVYSIELLDQISNDTFSFAIDCSSGTYIRSIARDLGYGLNSLATMTFLERTESGYFDLENAVKLDDFEESDEAHSKLINIWEIFPHFTNAFVSNNNFLKLRNGEAVKPEHLTIAGSVANENLLSEKEFFVFKDPMTLLGVGKVNNGVVRIKTFLLEN